MVNVDLFHAPGGQKPKMCWIIGLSTTGAMGLGISPVSGRSRVPLPAAKTIAFTMLPAPLSIDR